jgi:hypothetical protein
LGSQLPSSLASIVVVHVTVLTAHEPRMIVNEFQPPLTHRCEQQGNIHFHIDAFVPRAITAKLSLGCSIEAAAS